jgi:hypothetical protein
MKPFRTPDEMRDAHEHMFGEAGRQCADVVLKWAATLFAAPLDSLNIRIVLAPVELGPYNRHAGYVYNASLGAFILGNRHIVELRGGSLALKRGAADHLTYYQDFIVHELTHVRQDQLLREHAGEPDWRQTRGAHRDLGWYSAVAEACPKYLGVECPRSSWPTGPRTKPGTLTEVEMTHWPESLRALVHANDPRLPKITAAA